MKRQRTYPVKAKYWVILVMCLAVFSLQAFDMHYLRNTVFDFRGSENVKSVDTAKKWPASFGFGRAAMPQEIARIDIDVRPDGLGLPAGSGTVSEGKAIYTNKCLVCHGGPRNAALSAALIGPALITDTAGRSRAKTIGNYWPYASTVYDYINRAMPYNAPGSLKPNEVYSLTAYLLNANRIIPADAVMNSKTLPKVVMPAQKLFIPDDRRGGPEVR